MLEPNSVKASSVFVAQFDTLKSGSFQVSQAEHSKTLVTFEKIFHLGFFPLFIYWQTCASFLCLSIIDAYIGACYTSVIINMIRLFNC